MLHVRDLTLRYGGKKILEGVSFDLDKGHCLIISGKKGSGKTTILKALLGMIRPSLGSIELDFHSLSHLNRKEKKQFLSSTGVFLDEVPLSPYDRVSDLLDTEDLLQCLELTEKKSSFVSELSSQEKRALELLSVLKRQALFFLLDEPLIIFEPALRNMFQEKLLELKKNQCTIIIASSFPEEYYFLNPEKILELPSI